MDLRKATRMLDDAFFVQRVSAAFRMKALDVLRDTESDSGQVNFANGVLRSTVSIDGFLWACACDEGVQSGATLSEHDTIQTDGVLDEEIARAISENWVPLSRSFNL